LLSELGESAGADDQTDNQRQPTHESPSDPILPHALLAPRPGPRRYTPRVRPLLPLIALLAARAPTRTPPTSNTAPPRADAPGVSTPPGVCVPFAVELTP